MKDPPVLERRVLTTSGAVRLGTPNFGLAVRNGADLEIGGPRAGYIR
jgi:hypothetical protein